ncbi:superoxide reductase [Prevotella sp. DNF00663]|nr:superoxide reductase [Prevotella sp. DNF00663]
MKLNEIYRSTKCGSLVEVLNPTDGELACCGEPMELLKENSVDAAKEKHVPVVEKIEGGYRVTVGSVAHPMLEEHSIQWIELIAGDMVMRKYLKPGEAPVAEFKTDATDVYAREYCNLHGLWRS